MKKNKKSTTLSIQEKKTVSIQTIFCAIYNVIE